MRTYERLTREDLQKVQTAKLQRLVDRLRDHPYYKKSLNHLPASLTHEHIADIPTTDKFDYLRDQDTRPPYGERLGIDTADIAMAHMTGGTSGQGREVHGLTWRDVEACGHLSGTAFQWAGLNPGESAGFHIGMSNATGGNAMLRGIQSIGNVPTLVATLGFEDRLHHMKQFPMAGFFATPSAINGLAATASEIGMDLRTSFPDLRFMLTAAEPYPLNWANLMEERWGAKLYEDYGATQSASSISASTCELGAVVEGQRGGMHLYEWSFLMEILDPETTTPVEPGEFGELVITTLDKDASAVVRYRTRDRVKYLGWNNCPCGRELMVMECGSISRYDDMLKIKGQNVWPAHMEELILNQNGVREFRGRVRIDTNGRDDLLLEVAITHDATTEVLAQALRSDFKQEFNINPTVEIVDITDLPQWNTPEAKARRFVDERYDALAQQGSSH